METEKAERENECEGKNNRGKFPLIHSSKEAEQVASALFVRLLAGIY